MDTDSYFQYAGTFWCLNMFGAKLDTKALCGLSQRLGLQLDLVPKSEWPAVQNAGVGLSTPSARATRSAPLWTTRRKTTSAS